MNLFSVVFLAAVLTTLLLKIWLALRHVSHIAYHRDRVPPEFAGRVSLAAHRKAADYSSEKTRLSVVESLVDAALLLALTLGGGVQWIDERIVALFGEGLVHGLALIAAVTVVAMALSLPFSVYRTFVIEERYGFNKMTPRLFVIDLVKQALLAVVFGVPLVLAVLWMMRGLGGLWWLYAWFAWIAFSVLILAIFPTWIAPLFNKFSPLTNPDLKARIEGLLARCGFRSQGLFVMDGSKRSAHGNAYFTGFGKSKRIVFFDTLLERLEASEIEAVLAHELGHFKRRHVAKRIALSFATSFVFLALLGWLIDKPWFYQGLNVATPSTGMALVLFFLVVPAFTFILQPLSSFYSRKHEFEADAYAAQQTRAADLVNALVKLYEDNAATLTPDPLHSAVYDSHPPAAVRIAHLKQV